MPEFLLKLRASPWVVVCLLALAAAVFLPIWPDGAGGRTTMVGYALSWLGSCFQAMSAAVLGWWFCRRVLRLNVSEIAEPIARALAGLGQSVVIGAFVIAVAVAV